MRVCWHVHGPNSIMSSSCVTFCFLLSCFLAFISLLYIVGQFLVYLREQKEGLAFNIWVLLGKFTGENTSLYTIEKESIEMAPGGSLNV